MAEALSTRWGAPFAVILPMEYLFGFLTALVLAEWQASGFSVLPDETLQSSLPRRFGVDNQGRNEQLLRMFAMGEWIPSPALVEISGSNAAMEIILTAFSQVRRMRNEVIHGNPATDIATQMQRISWEIRPVVFALRMIRFEYEPLSGGHPLTPVVIEREGEGEENLSLIHRVVAVTRRGHRLSLWPFIVALPRTGAEYSHGCLSSLNLDAGEGTYILYEEKTTIKVRYADSDLVASTLRDVLMKL
jgi:hypothetical protein